MRLDADGDTQIDAAVSMLIPVAPDQASITDSFDIEYSRPNGTIINKINIETQNFEVITDLRFRPENLDIWLVHGTFDARAFQARIPRLGPLYSQLATDMLIEPPRSCSSSSKSMTVLLPSTLPSLCTALVLNRMASARLVFPQPWCPTSAKLRMSDTLTSFMELFSSS